ncbi:MAG: hypothetical protein K0Q59_4627 [Paenibacillus sp.]|nr:hypothetical protein [Paenibacillus sp.]
MNKGQQIAKLQQYAEAKIATQAIEDKQAYAASRIMENDGDPEKDEPKQGNDKL